MTQHRDKLAREPTQAETDAVRKAIYGYHNAEEGFSRLSPSQQDDWVRMAREGARALLALTALTHPREELFP